MKTKSTFALVLALVLMFTATMSVNAALPSSMTWDSEGNVTFHDAPKPYVGDTELPPLNPNKKSTKLLTHTFYMDDPNIQKYPILATITKFSELGANAEWYEDDGSWTYLTNGVWHTPEFLEERAQDPDYAIYDNSGRNAYEYMYKPRREWMQHYLKTEGIDISGMLDSDKIPIIRDIFEDGEDTVEKFMRLGEPDFELGEIEACLSYAQATEAMMQALDFEVFVGIQSRADWAIGRTNNNGLHTLNMFCEVYRDGTISPPIFVDSYWGLWGFFGDQMKEAGQTLGFR